MSMRITIFASIMGAGVICMLILTYTLLMMYKSNEYSRRRENIEADVSILTSIINSSGYMYSPDNDSVSAEIDAIAGVYEGRILVVDKNLNIVKDTYGKETGKVCISNEVVVCINEEMEQKINSKNSEYVELLIPVKDTENQVIGALVMGYSEKDIHNNLVKLHSNSVMIVLILILLLGIPATLISGKISKSMNKLKKSVDNVSAGYMDEEVHVDDFGECQELSDSLNTMLSQIQRLENSRQEFVSNVSHELKTPITSMKILADSLLGQENVPEELYQEFMADIASEIDRENKIITDLLSLVRMDKSAASLNAEPVNINELIEMLLKRLKPLANERNIEVIFESFRPVTAEVDETKLSLAFNNLIENAIKYNYDDGWVRVSLNADYKYFYVKVSDSGVGIPEDCIDSVFERFYRVDKARSRQTGGTGLGLAITRNVILMHKGAIKVHSKEKEGTTFTVRIPLNYVV